jgi:hypothetical protein
MYTEDEMDLLREWREKVAGWRWLHYESMTLYKKLNTRYVYASILLSTLAGAGSFTTGGGSGNSMGISDRNISLIIGGVNVIISLLNSVQRFTKAAEKTELHASAAMQYAMIYRFIDTELQLSDKHQRQDLIQYVRQEIDRLLSQSPLVPDKIIKNFNISFPDTKHKPDVCAGISTPTTVSPPGSPTAGLREVGSSSSLEPRYEAVYNQMRQQFSQTDHSHNSLDFSSPPPAVRIETPV